MKRRKGVTVFSVLSLTFTVLSAAAFLVMMLVLAPMFVEQSAQAQVVADSYNFVARNQDILAAFTTFGEDLKPNITVFATLGFFLIVSVIWLIVDLKRNRKIGFFFVLLFLLSTYLELIYTFALNQNLIDFIQQAGEANPDKAGLLLIPVLIAILPVLGSLFSLILFIVDMATGRVVKEATPTFIKEPTEEVQEGVFEEVKDENEVEEAKEEEKEPEVAPAPVEEEKKEEEASAPLEEKEPEVVEEAPEEVKEEAPAKKPSAPKKVKKEPVKKEEKKAPAKKAEEKKPAEKKEAPKKEEAKKPAPAKKAEKKEEAPKADEARKTQTILLENEEGKTYAKAFHVSRRPELNKWQVKATGSDKALKLFNTQKEAIEYANQLAKNQNVSVRVHSKEGKIRKHQ